MDVAALDDADADADADDALGVPPAVCECVGDHPRLRSDVHNHELVPPVLRIV